MSKIIKFGKIGVQSKVLDMCFGTGEIAIPLFKESSAMIVGLDISNNMLAKASKKSDIREVLLVQGNQVHLPFKNDHFDCLFIFLGLHHNNEKVEAILEFYRVLKYGGRCLIRTVSHSQLSRSIISKFFFHTLEIDLNRFPSIKNLKDWLRSAGFIKVWTDSFGDDVRTSVSGPNITSGEFINKIEKNILIPSSDKRRRVTTAS